MSFIDKETLFDDYDFNGRRMKDIYRVTMELYLKMKRESERQKGRERDEERYKVREKGRQRHDEREKGERERKKKHWKNPKQRNIEFNGTIYSRY